MKSWFRRAPRIRFEPISGPVLGKECNGFFLCESNLCERDIERLRAAAANGWRPAKWERLPDACAELNGAADEIERLRAMNCTYGNPDCPKCNPPSDRTGAVKP